MPLLIVRDNIVHMKTDAIVNAANERLNPGGGVCGSIFDKAGYDDMLKACRRIGGCKTGQAVITPGYALPAKYVIHAVGPIWNGGDHGEEELLRSAYKMSLEIAKSHKLKSIAFPLISSGIYGCPKEEALRIAVAAISEFVLQNEMNVYLVMYDRESFALSRQLVEKVESYIDDCYVQSRESYRHLRPDGTDARPGSLRVCAPCETVESNRCAPDVSDEMPNAFPDSSLSDMLNHLDETFSQSLLRIIDEQGKKDSDVYNRANIDRRLFSKIRANKDYKPTKQTAVAFCIALELPMEEASDLLSRAGYVLTHANKFDIIVEYYIRTHNYNIFELNEMLFYYDQPLLGSVSA